jgi:hypothetical protein
MISWTFFSKDDTQMIPRIIIPIQLGLIIEVAGIILGIILLTQTTPTNPPLINLILLSITFLLFWYFPHSLSHYLIGRLLGIKFNHYYLHVSGMSRIDNSFLAWTGRLMPMLGVKADRHSLRSATPNRRAAMYASGVTVSMITPVICIYTAFAIAAPYIGLLLTAVLVGNGLFTVYFSGKVGDIAKAIKTRFST